MYATYLAAVLWLLMALGLVLAAVMWRMHVKRARRRREAADDYEQLSW